MVNSLQSYNGRCSSVPMTCSSVPYDLHPSPHPSPSPVHLRVPDQNVVTLAWYIVEIHHSGLKPSISGRQGWHVVCVCVCMRAHVPVSVSVHAYDGRVKLSRIAEVFPLPTFPVSPSPLHPCPLSASLHVPGGSVVRGLPAQGRQQRG